MTKEPLIDHRGTKIEVGSTVAYNLSGEVATGVVLSAAPAIKDGWMYKKRANIQIRVTAPKKRKGGLSVVKSPKNVLVIFEDPLRGAAG